MEEFAVERLRQFPLMLSSALSLVWEFKGVFAEEAIKLVLLPFREFSIASCVVSAGWLIIFWRNKGLFLSGLSHMLNFAEWFTGVLKKVWLNLKRVG